jgi:hypothetical protein
VNHYDAREIIRRHNSGLPIRYGSVAEAEAYLTGKPVVPPPAVMPGQVKPPMSARCVCGQRYGMHRVFDFACMNPKWRPGNGQAQWLKESFRRAES